MDTIPATIRPATADDLPQCQRVWLATERYTDPVAHPVLPLHAHELRTGRLIVAVAGGDVVGFGATIVRSGVLYLADLFVLPEQHGHGIGGRLLDDLLAGHAGPRFTMASSSPAARSLYARYGMAPAWELAYVVGRAHSIARERLVELASPIELHAATIGDVTAMDREVTGRDRRPELEHETATLGGTLLAARRGGEVVGHALVIQPTWWVPWRATGTRVAPVVVGDPADAAPVAAAAVVHALDRGATIINSFVPVPHAAHAALLHAGFRRVDTDLHMTSEPGLVDPRRYLPSIDTV